MPAKPGKTGVFKKSWKVVKLENGQVMKTRRKRKNHYTLSYATSHICGIKRQHLINTILIKRLESRYFFV